MKKIITFEGGSSTLEEFIKENTDADEGCLFSDDELAELLTIEVGESCFIAVHAGWLEVTRIQ